MTTRLVLALHFHQPVGNFDQVFRDAMRLCYAPLVDHFERHPGISAAFHLSGSLLEWLESHDRPFLDRVFSLVASGRVEPMGGGFYEPILPIIPREDALEQIDRLASYWERRCGARPRGAWIAERVWEPGLAELLALAGVHYTILDDQHLRFAGLLDERFSGLYVTERVGQAVGFLPSDFRLRYLIPFRTIEAVREHFAGLGSDGRDWTLTYGDDAEKFGLWPGTHRWVFGEGWLESFFRLLEEENGPVRAVSPASFLAESPPARKVYIPNASYTEMLEWALPAASVAPYGATRRAALAGGAPPESVRAFVRGSLWDMFLARYPEADQLHKHVVWTSRRARALPPAASGRAEAITAVLRAECNCAYWHGLFGGIYFPHLRHGAFSSVLEADATLGRDAAGRVIVEAADLDGDLEREVVIRSASTQAFFRPSDGGTLVELDWLPVRFNVTNVVSRWRESYHAGSDLTHAPEPLGVVASPHEKAVGMGPSDLEGRVFDEEPLRSLRDFVAAAPPSPESLARLEGLDLARGRLDEWAATDAGFSSRARLGGLVVSRVVAMKPTGEIRVAWRVQAEGPAAGWFGTLLCLSLLTRKAPDRALTIESGREEASRHAPGDALQERGVSRIVFEDRAFGFALDLAPHPAACLITVPIETLQRSEDRFEAAYQGTLVALCWSLESVAGIGDGPALVLSFRPIIDGARGA